MGRATVPAYFSSISLVMPGVRVLLSSRASAPAARWPKNSAKTLASVAAAGPTRRTAAPPAFDCMPPTRNRGEASVGSMTSDRRSATLRACIAPPSAWVQFPRCSHSFNPNGSVNMMGAFPCGYAVERGVPRQTAHTSAHSLYLPWNRGRSSDPNEFAHPGWHCYDFRDRLYGLTWVGAEDVQEPVQYRRWSLLIPQHFRHIPTGESEQRF